jgi:methyl-accepting chemotaxis protein
MFDPLDDLYKLIARFNQHAVQQIASQVSQICIQLDRQHVEIHTAVEDISRQVGLLSQKADENSVHVRRASDLLEKMVGGISPQKI